MLGEILARIEKLESLIAQALRRVFSTPIVEHGKATLANGVSAAIAAPGLSATSSIVCTGRTQSADNTTVRYQALEADRTYGAAGTFKITALTAAGALQNADDSDIDYVVVI